MLAGTGYNASLALAQLRLDSGLEVARPRPAAEVAEMFGISERTLRRYQKRLKLTPRTVPGKGKLVHYDPDEVRKALERGLTRASGSD